MNFTRATKRAHAHAVQITLGGNCVSASTAALFLALLLVLGVQPLVAGLLVVVAMFGVALLLRHAVIHGNLILATSRVLNLQALQMDLAWTLGHREILVPGDEKTLRPWSLRAPRGGDGLTAALYDRVFPLVWRRFSPALGDTRLSRSGAALVQHMYTEDVRQLLRR